MRTFHQTMSNPTAIDLRSTPIFQLSDEELRERLRPTYERMKAEKFAKGGYLTYYDPTVCPNNTYAVHEYSDRKELVKLDENGKAQYVKTL
ncbi:hypothetical protein [Mucilaginibacter ginsenosidivorax]|uniref:Uncharacterized protein n=1 Tax=Mucilaginibacter ginsenosidivorax TaxID=862126 RepID=A0A5B8W4M1_9SPHI|nr:hypothetical protein [Mucilaginibacter ginsenosidivorax]QEC77288.1 hypothetical protein FSB76_15545 [Mucilaginibacter ginsenosidivorax]